MFSQPDPRPPQRLGANFSASTPTVGVTVLVSSGANLAGIFVRTILIGGSATGSVSLRAGTRPLAFVGPNQTFAFFDGILIPAGQQLDLEVFTATAGGCHITWDLL